MQNLRAEEGSLDTLVHFTSEGGHVSDFLKGPSPQALRLPTHRHQTPHHTPFGAGSIRAWEDRLVTEGPVGGGEGLCPLLAQVPSSSTPWASLS